MELRVVSGEVSVVDATVIAGVLADLEPLPGSELIGEVDEALIAASGFEGKEGQVLRVPHPDAETLILVGLGDSPGFKELRAASGTAARKVRTGRAISLLSASGIDGATRAVVEGSVLGAYQYRTYKTDEEPLDLAELELADGDADAVAEAGALAAATNFARDWVNTPARDKSPSTLAESIAAVVSEAGVTTEIWDRSRIEAEALGGVLGVAAGSDRDPVVLKMTYEPASPKAHLALVGKGITFDSGGLSIKPAASMEEMKDDMSGAAVVSAAIAAIARIGLPVKVSCIAPLTDNAIGGDATRPGDVLRPADGPTIEVLNTDAEGRLILADGLGLAKTLDPDLIVDVATLTGAARVALGDKITAVFASDDDVADSVLQAASVAGETFWQMPLHKEYRKQIDSDIADIKNVSGSRYGGAIIAALFLAEYAGDGPWAHLDIAGPARARETSGEQVKGASGVGVRTLVELARSMGDAG